MMFTRASTRVFFRATCTRTICSGAVKRFLPATQIAPTLTVSSRRAFYSTEPSEEEIRRRGDSAQGILNPNADADDFTVVKDVAPDILALAKRICQLNMVEMHQLSQAMGKLLGISDEQLANFASGGGGGGGGNMANAGRASAPTTEAPKEEEKPKQEVFDVKLVKLDEGTQAKFKVLKEIRALRPGLGLADCKKLVDNLPAILIEAVKKEDAEMWKAKMKEAGAEVEFV